MRNSVGILESAIPSETVQHQCQALIPFHIARSFEVFIEDCANNIALRWNKTRRSDFIRELATDQPIIIGEIDIDLDKQRRASGCRCTCECRCRTWREG